MRSYRVTLSMFALTLALGSFAADAHAQDAGSTPSCRSVENCLCSVAGDPSGVYIGTVGFGSTESGIEVDVEQLLVEDTIDGSPIDTIVVRFDGIRNGDRILFSSRGYLIDRGGAWACPAGSLGEGLRISTNDARRLVRATSCFNELSTITIGGQYPPCDDSADGGALLCSHAPARTAWPLLLGIGALAVTRRRPRRA